jgi:hypothetical protein
VIEKLEDLDQFKGKYVEILLDNAENSSFAGWVILVGPITEIEVTEGGKVLDEKFSARLIQLDWGVGMFLREQDTINAIPAPESELSPFGFQEDER